MSTRALMRKLEDFEGPRLVALGGALFGASFFLMKLLPARFMLERAVERDQLKPEATICESSSGTFGLALAMLAVQQGYRLILVSDWALDRHLHRRLIELGADVTIVDSPAASGGLQQARLDRLHIHLRDIAGSYWPSQYDNPDNPISYAKVAEQFIDRLGKVDCLVGPVGSGGSVSGISCYLRTLFADLYAIGVDTPNSVLFGQPSGKLNLSGLGGNILPRNVDHRQFDEVHWVTPAEAFHATHDLHRKHGLFMGPTSGAAYRVARWWAEANPGKTVVALFPDEGHRYVETVYDHEWLKAVAGWSKRPAEGPTTVSSPRSRMARWSRLPWERRTLHEVLAHAGDGDDAGPAAKS
ncbi:pyridoxal-phosphate dependent enzyme [Mesorhizobium sp. BR1-1-6]|uniref:pyridoxal-phosphate dependent enzyme n=1 Tax=unclassified Mesorhizobium TaxID=325217 RepID=UPI001126B460|nr:MULTISPECIES: pyridoxal-phosphate dependent enzyme [unclassified Mesorhizobium]TPL32230.1 pyridoxal-phosphate dependent enzyme [Mesorhizobium sp. B2-4-8]TPM98656.1 pyridoxal-phosphate dependent enzyme [Mesorhizobium sp. B2-1-5]TPN30462.1 pyridoxal-phosphate dependent enzyme [Mesorhizobium sp. B1-1-6]MBZ9894647.1 pyridoxal-phosphate dependent enzyme [Mesorhizobium sp. BR1-1-6]TPL21003.1 pyridoxal-phosphate dependent enzyme [Mesorhizobium sp. B2-4-9]